MCFTDNFYLSWITEILISGIAVTLKSFSSTGFGQFWSK